MLLRYYDSYIPYARTPFHVESFAQLIRQTSTLPFVLSGKSEIVEQFEHVLPLGNKRVTYFCECQTDKYATGTDNIDIKKTTLDDVDRIIALRQSIAEFTTTPRAREMLVQDLETILYEEDGKMVASASTTAENSLSAMIVGVCTEEAYRQKGYASAIIKI